MGDGMNYTESQRRRQQKKEIGEEEDWGVVALYSPINQHHSKGLGVAFICVHTHTHVCLLLINVPMWECQTTKCLIGYFASESIILPQTGDCTRQCTSSGREGSAKVKKQHDKDCMQNKPERWRSDSGRREPPSSERGQGVKLAASRSCTTMVGAQPRCLLLVCSSITSRVVFCWSAGGCNCLIVRCIRLALLLHWVSCRYGHWSVLCHHVYTWISDTEPALIKVKKL